MVSDARTIRPAREGDAAGIGLVHVRSWQAAYRGAFPEDFLEALDPAQRGEGWRRWFEGDHRAGEALLVADVEGVVAGFAVVGPSRDGDARGEGEVQAIYLHPDHWDQGLGGALMAGALGALAGEGFADAVLWVLDTNQRARRFYEAGGWTADGASKRDESFGFPIAESRYRRTLP